MTTYIKLLISQIPRAAPQRPPDLRQRFLDWYNQLPEIARQRPFSMVELERALNTQGKADERCADQLWLGEKAKVEYERQIPPVLATAGVKVNCNMTAVFRPRDTGFPPAR